MVHVGRIQGCFRCTDEDNYANVYVSIMYLNCGGIYEDVLDLCSYVHNLSSCEIKA